MRGPPSRLHCPRAPHLCAPLHSGEPPSRTIFLFLGPAHTDQTGSFPHSQGPLQQLSYNLAGFSSSSQSSPRPSTELTPAATVNVLLQASCNSLSLGLVSVPSVCVLRKLSPAPSCLPPPQPQVPSLKPNWKATGQSQVHWTQLLLQGPRHTMTCEF